MAITTYFQEWKTYVDGLKGFKDNERSKMFVSHWLYTDLRRTCHSMCELVSRFLTGSNRVWILRAFNQDPIESAFGQCRGLGGDNRTMDHVTVDVGFAKIRAFGLKDSQVVRS